jgi:hypothetical protein
VTIVPKRALMNFDWGCRVSQEPSFQKSDGAASVFVYVTPFHLGKVFSSTAGIYFDLKKIGNRYLDVTDDPITQWMTMVALNTGRAAEVREHTNLMRPPRPL